MAEKNKAKIVAGLLNILRLPVIDSVGTFLWANAPTPRAPQCVWRALLFPHPLFNLDFRQSLLPQLCSITGQLLTLLGELLRRSHRWDLLHEWSQYDTVFILQLFFMDKDREKRRSKQADHEKCSIDVQEGAAKAFALVGDSYRHRYSRPFSR